LVNTSSDKEYYEKPNNKELNNKELVDIFFNRLDDRRIIFVFDNVDSYIDLERFVPSGEMGYLFKQALSHNHNSKFVFTCRPLIREAGSNFYQISLPGLTLEETIELFHLYHVSASPADIEILIKKVHSLTRGHPLWLNLIAAQACRGLKTVNEFLNNIENRTNFDEDNFTSILSDKILSQIWTSLNNKQQSLLRGIAETVKPETIDNLRKILNSELNNNQFNKAFKALRGLNLIELKKSSISQDLVELHPLVKEFVLFKFQRTERNKYITLLVKFYQGFIVILKPKLSSELTLNEYLYWTSNVELLINKGDYKNALIALEEVSFSILAAGYIEEYLRVSEKLLQAIDWHDAIENEYTYFHGQLQRVIKSSIEFGRYSNADKYICKYDELIPERNALYLGLCSLKCYFHWFQDNFEEAILWGEKGEYLLSESKLSDNYELLHVLALARRDSKNKTGIERALSYFLKNETIENVVDVSIPISFNGDFYGNIGKCLEYLGKREYAMICYFKSLFALLNNKDKEKLNIGYAYYWISYLLIRDEHFQDGLYFLKYAIISTEFVSPPKSKLYKDIWMSIVCDVKLKEEIDSKQKWQIEEYCGQELERYLNKKTN
jgi:tetratricopeptide (TPR) repeat protein